MPHSRNVRLVYVDDYPPVCEGIFLGLKQQAGTVLVPGDLSREGMFVGAQTLHTANFPQDHLYYRHGAAARLRQIVLLGSALMLALSTNTSLAQTTSGASLSGSVADPRGGLLAKATILVRDEVTGETHTKTADGQGHFAIQGLAAGTYNVQASAPGFGATVRAGVRLVPDAPSELNLRLAISDVSQQITVEANASGSIAAALAPMDGLLEARSARTEISSSFIRNFTPPVSDFTEVMQMAPGTFSVNPNGIGLGNSKMYFRGFPDGTFNIDFDGIPFNNTNAPSHHSWAFFPSLWLGGVDFDRSPGSASTIGPTPFGGTINLLSRDLPPIINVRGGVSYGSFNTMLTDVQFDSGDFLGKSRRASLTMDFNRLTSDGFQTWNAQERNAGALKMRFDLSVNTTLTGFSGVLWLDTNTPSATAPTRGQIAQFGYRYLLQNTDPTLANYAPYNYNHLPTDFEYVAVRSDLGKGWRVDAKPYTYSYSNQQNYAAQPKTGAINLTNCVGVKGIQPCGTDKLDSYRKYGQTSTISESSRYGVLRLGMWYEWATTNRHQTPQNPITHRDDLLSNFDEKFYTNSYQPFAEYEYHATHRLTLTGGFKYAYYNQNFTQFADNGKTVGSLGGAASVNHIGAYHSYLPSADANYRLKANWSVYGQFSTGSVIPPSSVFDTTGANTLVLPQPTNARTYQGGSVLKLKRTTLDLDVYYTHFQNTYAASPDPNATSATQYTQSGDSVTKGFEGETNIYITHGLSLYANGTAGVARYATPTLSGIPLGNYNQWVANTPANTEALGLTYQQKYLDVGLFHKRIGPMWNNSTAVSGATLNQVVPIDPFDVENAFFNYTIRSGSHLDGTKVRFSVNNILNAENITGLTAATPGQIFVPSNGDTLSLLPGRSFTISVTFGYAQRR